MGHPTLTTAKADRCKNCGEPICNHQKRRENHENGYSYNYYCDDGRRLRVR